MPIWQQYLIETINYDEVFLKPSLMTHLRSKKTYATNVYCRGFMLRKLKFDDISIALIYKNLI